MKRTMISILILTVLSFGVPTAGAEISKDLDPMVSPEVKASVTSGSSVESVGNTQASDAVSTVDAAKEEKKLEEPKKEKSKKASEKKSSKKKKKNSSSKSSKKHKKSSN